MSNHCNVCFSDDEWESEQVGEELDAAEAAVAAAETSLLEFAASRLPISEDPLVRTAAFLEFSEAENKESFRISWSKVSATWSTMMTCRLTGDRNLQYVGWCVARGSFMCLSFRF